MHQVDKKKNLHRYPNPRQFPGGKFSFLLNYFQSITLVSNKDTSKKSSCLFILVSIIIHEDLSIDKKIIISSNGLPNFNSEDIMGNFKEKFIIEYMKISENKKNSDEAIKLLIKKSIREIIKKESDKKPEIKSHIIRL